MSPARGSIGADIAVSHPAGHVCQILIGEEVKGSQIVRLDVAEVLPKSLRATDHLSRS